MEIADSQDVSRIKANVEKFNQGLEQLDRTLPLRTTRAIRLDVTEKFREFLPSRKMGDAIIFLQDVGLSPQRMSNNKKYYIYVNVQYDKLAASNRIHFVPGDVLVISFVASSPENEADVLSLKIVLSNDQGTL